MAGRELPPSSPFAGDDGSAAPAVREALAAVGAGTGTVAQVVTALAGTRVLVPVLAEVEPDDEGSPALAGHEAAPDPADPDPAAPDPADPDRADPDDGQALHAQEKAASAGIVALRAPDGRTALPVFSSVAAMAAWRSDARPVPSDVARAALSAVTEGWELLVLDPGGPVTVLVPRPAVWALAQGQAWEPAVLETPAGRVVDPEVRAAVRSAALRALPTPDRAGGWWGRVRRAEARSVLADVDVSPGDRAEVAVELALVAGLGREALDAASALVSEALGADETVTRRVDSLELRLRES